MPILTHFNWPESIVQRQCHARQAGLISVSPASRRAASHLWCPTAWCPN